MQSFMQRVALTSGLSSTMKPSRLGIATFDIFTPDDIVAHDIIINTDGADAIFIDRIVFHDIILPDDDTPPIAVAEPSSAMLIGSAGLFAAVLRRRRPAWLSPQRATSVPAATSQMRTTSS